MLAIKSGCLEYVPTSHRVRLKPHGGIGFRSRRQQRAEVKDAVGLMFVKQRQHVRQDCQVALHERHSVLDCIVARAEPCQS